MTPPSRERDWRPSSSSSFFRGRPLTNAHGEQKNQPRFLSLNNIVFSRSLFHSFISHLNIAYDIIVSNTSLSLSLLYLSLSSFAIPFLSYILYKKFTHTPDI